MKKIGVNTECSEQSWRPMPLKVVETEDVSCSKHGGMWVSESYLSYSHWAMSMPLGLKEAGIHKKPHHPALDPDSIE